MPQNDSKNDTNTALTVNFVTTLKPKQRKAVECLANGGTFEQAATAAGVSERTLARWRNDPAFVDALNLLDTDHLGQLARSLTVASHTALEVLIKVMTNEKTRDSVRVRAAGEVLKHRAVFADLLTLADRLAALEERIL